MLNDEEGIDAKKHGQTSVVNAVGALFTGLWEPGFICSHGHEQKHFNDKGLVAGREPFKVVAIEIQTYDGLPLTTLREAWEQFRQAEGMEKSFAYVCWTCGCRKPPRKIMHVVSAPKILCLHLKRWTVCQKTQRGQLLKHPVDFELTADFLSTVTNCAELYSTEAPLQAAVIIGPWCGTTRNGGYTTTA